jgi:hypothetical protein
MPDRHPTNRRMTDVPARTDTDLRSRGYFGRIRCSVQSRRHSAILAGVAGSLYPLALAHGTQRAV